MNSFKLTNAIRLVLVSLVATGALVLAGNRDQIQAQTIQTNTKNTTRWEWTDDGLRRRVEIQGKAEFPEDYSDVIGLSEGGFVRLDCGRDDPIYRRRSKRAAQPKIFCERRKSGPG